MDGSDSPDQELTYKIYPFASRGCADTFGRASETVGQAKSLKTAAPSHRPKKTAATAKADQPQFREFFRPSKRPGASPGAYQLFIYASDDHGNVATGNNPF